LEVKGLTLPRAFEQFTVTAKRACLLFLHAFFSVLSLVAGGGPFAHRCRQREKAFEISKEAS
jgi:aspartokinase-like uncharacterized kinase